MTRFRIALLTTALALAAAAGIPAQAQDAMSVFVDPHNGVDDQDGMTSATALRTLEAAERLVRARPTRERDVVVYLRGGYYFIPQTLTMGPLDGGDGEHTVTYRAFDGDEQPVISGGLDLTGLWSDADGDGIYQAPVPQGVRSRHLFVAGRPAVLARADKPFEQVTITDAGFVANDGPLADYANPDHIEFAWAGSWKWKIFSAERIERRDGRIIVTMKQPGWSLRSGGRDSIENPDYTLSYKPNAFPALVQNALELLDEPGEWYFDATARIAYYKPAPGVDMATAESLLARVDNQLLRIEGTRERPVRNLRFEGLSFQHATYMAPQTTMGHAGNQSNAVRDEAGSTLVGPSPASVEVRYGDSIAFIGTDFSNSGPSGLFFDRGSRNSVVEGSTFNQLGSNGIQVGDFRRSLADIDSCTGCATRVDADRVDNITVSNNYIHRIGIDMPTAAQGIHVGWATHVTVSHNDLHDLGYTAIALGYRWTDTPGPFGANRVVSNRIFDVLRTGRDGAGIYSVGNQGFSGEPTVVSGNHVFGVHNEFAALYADEGSSDEIWEHNVVENLGGRRWFNDNSTGQLQHQSGLLIRDNFTDSLASRRIGLLADQRTRSFMPGDPPLEAEAIRQSAGLEGRFAGLLDYRPAYQAEDVTGGRPLFQALTGANGRGAVSLGVEDAVSMTVDAGLGGPGSLNLRYASTDGATVQVTVNGETHEVMLPATTSWSSLSVPMTFGRGLAPLRVVSTKGTLELDQLSLSGLKALGGPADLIPNSAALTRLATLGSASGWTTVDQLFDGFRAHGGGHFQGSEASLTFNFDKTYRSLIFSVTPETGSAYGLARWKIQIANSQDAWVDATPWIVRNAAHSTQTYQLSEYVRSQRARVLFEADSSYDGVGVAEVAAFGTDVNAAPME